MSDRSTVWAFSLFRPILQQLKVQDLKENPVVFKASEHRELIVAGMRRWVIVARQFSFRDQSKGFAKVIYSKTHNLFLLMVCIDKDLYRNDELELRKQRKLVAVHEFVHGTAHMCLESLLKSEKYIECMKESIKAKMERTSSDEFNEMVLAIGKLGTKDGTKYETFTDDHFRLLWDNSMDGFDGNFAELYTELMLSYQLVSETMTALRIQRGPGANILELLTLAINELIQTKALDKEFVVGRIKLFLARLYADFS